MFTTTFKTLAVWSALAALVACEGEPPKVPTTPSRPEASQAAEPTPAEPANTAAGAQPAPAGATAGQASGCPCMGGEMHGDMRAMHEAMHGQSAPPSSAAPASTGTAAAAATTGAPAAVAAAPAGAEVAAPAAAHANVIGTVTTTPARSAGAAVVYLEDAPVLPNRGMSAAIDNKGMSFIPFVTVVAAGGRVMFSNSDPFPHNVFSPDNERFNLGMIAQKGAGARVFKTPGVYSLLCNLHPNMLGYIVVTPSSYFAKANGKGQFTLKDVPAGTYKITAWAPRQQPVTQSITVKDVDVTADFALHR